MIENFKVRLACKLMTFLPMSRCHKLKAHILRFVGLDIGENVEIWSTAKFYSPYIKIGSGTFIGYNVQLFAQKDGAIEIGCNCAIGTDVIISTGTHELGPPTKRSGRGYCKPISIKDGVRISTRALIIEGATIGRGGQVAAGAVVINDVAENTMVAGVPARFVKNLPI